ncbi:MAG: ABC transporter substrate-binding protein [Calditrichaeota bacterium]|nr:MAG: ABC transporter substrate-binding protein [Calditrichota bacterium]
MYRIKRLVENFDLKLLYSGPSFAVLFYVILFFCSGCDFSGSNNKISEGIESVIFNLDPATIKTPEDNRIVSLIYEPLVGLSDDYKTFEPGLAEKWSVSSDQRSYFFSLKPGIFFQDNSPVNTEALVFAFQRQMRLNLDSPLFSMIDSIHIIDSLTMRFTLKYPYTPFLYTLTSPVGLKGVSKKAILKYGDKLAEHPVGSGPYMFKKLDDNSELVLTKFELYPNHLPNIDQISFKVYSDYSEISNYFKESKIDLLYLIPGFYIDRLKWLGVVDYQVLPATSTVMIGFNSQSPPFHLPEVRRAVLLAINREKLVYNFLRGNSIPAKGPLPPVLFNYREITQPGYNPEKAAELLAKAGYPHGFRASFYYLDRYRARNTIFEAIKNDLEKAGIKLNLIPFYSWEELEAACRSDTSQVYWTAWGTDVLGDPENFLYSLFHSSSPHNLLHFRNNAVDRLLEEARREPDRQLREELYRQIVELVLRDVPAVFMYHVIPVYAYNRNKIEKLPLDPYGHVQYQNIVLR